MSDPDDYLSQEYLHLQSVVEDFDGRALTVKAWSVTFSATAIGFAYANKIPAILLVAAISAFSFWIVEALVKVNQQAHYGRIRTIERHFARRRNTKPFQIGASWDRAFDKNRKFRRIFAVARWPHVFMPHIVIIALATGLWLFAKPGQEAGHFLQADIGGIRISTPPR